MSPERETALRGQTGGRYANQDSGQDDFSGKEGKRRG